MENFPLTLYAEDNENDIELALTDFKAYKPGNHIGVIQYDSK